MKACMRAVRKHGHWLFFGLMILLTVYMDAYVALNILDGDASDYLNRGWLMAQRNDPFIREYYFTTELRLLDVSTVFAAFFHLTGSWALVRIAGTVVMQAYYAAGFLYLCRQMGVKRSAAVWAAGMLLLPISTAYARIVLYHVYYILYLGHAFWLLGLTLRLLNTDRRSLPAGILLGLMWLYAGLNGIRLMMIAGLPMLLFAAAQLLCTLQNYRWEDGCLKGSEPLRQTSAVRLAAILAGSCLCFAVGYVIHKAVLLPYFGVYDASDTFFRPSWNADHYSDLFNGWLLATGARNTGAPLVGVRGLSLLAALFGFGYLLPVSLSSCLRQELPLGRRLACGMLGVAFTATTLVFVFESGESGGRLFQLYYVPVAAMAFPLLAHEIDLLREKSVSAAKKLLILLACACFLFQGAYSLFFIRADKEKLDTWDGLAYHEMDTTDQLRDCISFMQENGYTHALIDHWYANTMVEMTNGELSVCPLQEGSVEAGVPTIGRWGTSTAAFEGEQLPEQVIIFIKRSIYDLPQPPFPGAQPVHEGWVFNGYEVDAATVQ